MISRLFKNQVTTAFASCLHLGRFQVEFRWGKTCYHFRKIVAGMKDMVAFCEKLELYTWNYLIYSSHLKTSVAFHGCLCFSGQAALMNARAWWMRPLTDLGRNDLMVDGKWGFKTMANKQWAVPSLFFRSLELNEDALFIFSIPNMTWRMFMDVPHAMHEASLCSNP